MTSVDLKNIKGEVVGSFDLDDRVFGVEPNRAHELHLAAAAMGLTPHGLAFHVGSQMTQPEAWAR